VNWLPADPMEEMRLEIFSPPYLFKFDTAHPRPAIRNPDGDIAEIAGGDTITVQTTQAQQIKWVSLIRAGLTTHSFNSEQRLVDLPITHVLADRLDATVPINPNVAPPGWYMLFLTDQRGVPSVGRWVHVSTNT
jgi:hypothetical protein